MASQSVSATGVSVILHKTRIALGLTLEEYVLLDFIYEWNNKNATASPSFKDYFVATGIIRDDINIMFKKLHACGFLTMDSAKRRVTTTNAWNKYFDTPDSFERFWARHPQGNKATALNRFKTVVGKMKQDPNKLFGKLELYLANCATLDRFSKGLDVWLNPAKRHWDDPLTTRSNGNGNGAAGGPKSLDNYF